MKKTWIPAVMMTMVLGFGANAWGAADFIYNSGKPGPVTDFSDPDNWNSGFLGALVEVDNIQLTLNPGSPTTVTPMMVTIKGNGGLTILDSILFNGLAGIGIGGTGNFLLDVANGCTFQFPSLAATNGPGNLEKAGGGLLKTTISSLSLNRFDITGGAVEFTTGGVINVADSLNVVGGKLTFGGAATINNGDMNVSGHSTVDINGLLTAATLDFASGRVALKRGAEIDNLTVGGNGTSDVANLILSARYDVNDDGTPGDMLTLSAGMKIDFNLWTTGPSTNPVYHSPTLYFDILNLSDLGGAQNFVISLAGADVPDETFLSTPLLSITNYEDSFLPGGGTNMSFEQWETFFAGISVPWWNFELRKTENNGKSGFELYGKAVPEPGTWIMLLTGAAGLGGVAWRRRMKTVKK